MSRLSRADSNQLVPVDACYPAAIHSDKLVGVEHNTDLGTDGSRGEVLGEVNSNVAVVTVAGNNLTPDALVVGTSLCVLSSVDVGDALTVVESATLAVLASLDLNASLLFVLSPLSSFETQKSALDVKSAHTRVFRPTNCSNLPDRLSDLASSGCFSISVLSHLYVIMIIQYT